MMFCGESRRLVAICCSSYGRNSASIMTPQSALAGTRLKCAFPLGGTMDLAVWLYSLLATIILSLTPGPGVFSSISSGLHHGFRLGLWNGVGMQVANVLMVIVVALGLGTILVASETLFTAVKWLGVFYLVYLGIVTLLAAPR